MPRVKQEILEGIKKTFETFGDGQDSPRNKIAEQFKDSPLAFALGVQVDPIVEYVIQQYRDRIKVTILNSELAKGERYHGQTDKTDVMSLLDQIDEL